MSSSSIIRELEHRLELAISDGIESEISFHRERLDDAKARLALGQAVFFSR